NVLAADYEDHDIYFFIEGMSYIDDDDYYDISEAPGSVWGVNPHTDAIDIYLYPYNRVNQGGSSIASTNLYLGGSVQNTNIVGTSVLSHEVGHCLGLIHTHGHEKTCTEFVEYNIEECDWCGDRCCDTPADPNLWELIGTDCVYNESREDAYGDLYDPDTDNIMSYTHPTCMWKITPDQIDRIFCHLEEESILDPIIINTYPFWDTPPKPAGLAWSKVGSHPKLTWNASSNEDVAGYKIYRNLGGSYRYIGYTPGRDATVYIDYSLDVQLKRPMNSASYYVKAFMPYRDIVSPPSDPVSVPTNMAEKRLVDNFIVSEFALHNNRPNPFNPITLLQVDLPDESFVELTIYDFLGSKINTLLKGTESAGSTQVLWDGTNQRGQRVASGVYIYTLSAVSRESKKRFTDSRKMILLK
ncbi:MAG: FlgD immunoglobulin-like domain containing protein, partial [Fidelibacterota bacterium]